MTTLSARRFRRAGFQQAEAHFRDGNASPPERSPASELQAIDHVLRDQANAVLRAPEALGVELRILADN